MPQAHVELVVRKRKAKVNACRLTLAYARFRRHKRGLAFPFGISFLIDRFFLFPFFFRGQRFSGTRHLKEVRYETVQHQYHT